MTATLVRDAFNALYAKLAARFAAETTRIAQFIERRLQAMLIGWAVLSLLAGGLKVLALVLAHPKLATPQHLPMLILPYLLIAAAPAAGFALTTRCFADGALAVQPVLRLARFGHWQSVAPEVARRDPNFGVSGLMTSLVAGLLLSLAMRMGEYILAMPAVPSMAPAWAVAVSRAMTFDLIFFSFLYAVCITMALRAAPLFPRMLLYAWLCDIAWQLAIARVTIDAGGLPSEVALPLQSYLVANIKKVLISMTIWLPYLLVSARVNLTFRQRTRRLA